VNDRNPLIPPALLGRAALSRRSVLRGAGLAGAAAFLAACGVKGTGGGTESTTSGSSASGSSQPAGGATDLSDTDKTLTWSSWPEYLDVDEKDPNKHPSIDQFTKATGIKVNYVEDVNDNDQYFAKIQPLLAAGQTIAADVFVVTDWMVAKLMRLGYLDDIDHANIPNLKNLNPELENVTFDPGRKQSITWQSGFAGIAYNPSVTKPIESIDQLLTDPDLQYVLPEKGCTLWSDNFVIPKGSKHKKNAELLINFYYQPDIAAEVADYVNYISPVVGAKEALVKTDPDVANNPLIFPSADVMKRAKVFMALDEDQEKRYSAAFAKLMGS
jgi:spermidine/putrescine-binding protein